MTKLLLFIVAASLTVLLVAYIGLQFFLGSIVKAGVNNFAPRLTQTSVRLERANISPLSGAGTLGGLTVGNPKGWSGEKAFYLGRVHIEMQPFSIFKDHVVINDMVIEQPEFFYETHVVSSNIGDLLKNIEAATGSEKSATNKNGTPLKFEVRHFQLKGGKVSLGLGVAAIPLPMPDIELKDLGTAEGGITSQQLAFAIMRTVTSNVVVATTQAAGKIGGTMGAAAGDAAKKAGEGLKKLLGGKN